MVTRNTTAETVALKTEIKMITQFNQNEEVSITLKDLTDLIGVRHDKAMDKVLKLSEEPSFGLLSKMDTINLNGLKVETYLLTKKQAIAVGAKLNNSLLMKVIDKMEELEKARQTQTLNLTDDQQIALIARGHTKVVERVETLETKFTSFQETIPVDHWQQKELLRLKSVKVYSFKPQTPQEHSTLERKIGHVFKKRFGLPRYDALPRKLYDEAVQYLENFSPAQLAS